MAGLVPAIHWTLASEGIHGEAALRLAGSEIMDGRDKPGPDEISID